LSTAEDQRNGETDGESGAVGSLILKSVAAVWSDRRWVAVATTAGMVIAVGISFLLPKVYTSDALVNPDQQSLQGVSALSVLAGGGAIGSMLSTKSPGAVAINILGTRTAQDDIINRFGLMQDYHCKYYIDARRILAAKTKIDEDKKTGMVTIAVTDRDRYRARDLAKAYVEELNKLLNQENTSSAHLERVFLEGRLSSIKSELDETSIKLSQFSSRNATFNPQAQSQVLLQSATNLQNELANAQGELEGLKAQYSDDNIHIREARARIEELQRQLRKIGAGGTANGAGENSGEVSPSIRELPLLGVTYLDLSRQLNMQETLYDTLTKQYELAKVQEAKEIPTIKVIDEPELPERKSGPSRTLIVILATFLSFIASAVVVSVREILRPENQTNSLVAKVNSILLSIRSQDPASTS